MLEKDFIEALSEKGIHLTDEQIKQFELYYDMLIEWNEKINLTALTEKKEVYLKHFYDSITPAFYLDFTGEYSICDVGAGAGFPSIPLKICFPQLKMTVVDSLRKRIDFLEKVAEQLQLKNINFHHSRAEDFGKNKQFRETFDYSIARAVARMSVLSELCLPLVRVGGHFIAMKGAKAAEELKEGSAAIQRLGGEVLENNEFALPTEAGERSIIVIQKKKQTPRKYPRKPGTPQRNPLK